VRDVAAHLLHDDLRRAAGKWAPSKTDDAGRRRRAWELSLGLYLPVKGFKPSPITADMV
jgi:hypothetical protein